MPHSLRSFSHRSRSPLQVAILERKRNSAHRCTKNMPIGLSHAMLSGLNTQPFLETPQTPPPIKRNLSEERRLSLVKLDFVTCLFDLFSFNLLIVIIIALFWSCPCVIHLWRPVAWFQCFANVFDRSLNADGICGIFWVCPVWPWTRRLQFACLEVGRSWILL